jgi:hypothetical protein
MILPPPYAEKVAGLEDSKKGLIYSRKLKTDQLVAQTRCESVFVLKQ